MATKGDYLTQTKIRVQHERFTATYKKSNDEPEFELRENKKLVVSTKLAEDGHITFGPRAFPMLAQAIDWFVRSLNNVLERRPEPPRLKSGDDSIP
jgi:hypothetical protein